MTTETDTATTIRPSCPSCGGERIRVIERTQTAQDIELLDIAELGDDGPDVYEYGDTEAFYECSDFEHYECRTCMFAAPHLAMFVPDSPEMHLGGTHARHATTCGRCGRSWCDQCDPTPAAHCHWCNGRGYSTVPLRREDGS